MTTKSTKARRKRLAAVYREAARVIGEGETFYCCIALERIAHFEAYREPLISFVLWFRPRFILEFGSWWDYGHAFKTSDEAAYFAGQTPRVIALLLMAELAEDGQLD